MALSSARTKHWTRVEYERLVDLGAFRPGERLELVGGALVVREPQGGPHATAVGLCALTVAVVPGTRRDHTHAHPSHPALIVEVADSSLEFDREEKASLYARAGIADYWILEPEGRPHATGIRLAAAALRAAFGPGWTIEGQLPVALDEESEPEPDIAVLAGGPRDYLGSHQVTPALVVEVAISSLVLDREEKGSLYARAGIQDYWIVNLLDNVLEVYRNPAADPDRPYGSRYTLAIPLGVGAFVTPLAAPATRIAVADLLP